LPEILFSLILKVFFQPVKKANSKLMTGYRHIQKSINIENIKKQHRKHHKQNKKHKTTKGARYLKPIVINGKAVVSIWKTNKTNAEAKQHNTVKTKGSYRAAPFIPESYSDPTASAAMRNLIREEKQRKQEEQRINRRKNKRKKHLKKINRK
jgi:hypothetical protein